MRVFDPETRNLSDAHKRVYAYFELLYTLVDVLAAGMFIIGSILFLFPAWVTFATYLFILGSCFFALRPVLRLLRELKFLKMGEIDILAKREQD